MISEPGNDPTRSSPDDDRSHSVPSSERPVLKLTRENQSSHQAIKSMKAFTTHSGQVVAMDRSNIDTDQIIPKQFLKRIERTGFGQFLFYDWRFDEQGEIIPDFILNQPQFKSASILVARKNFGNGSSREHAVWALDDFGFRVVIAESFADIFYNNCSKNGVLPVRLAAEEVEQIHRQVAEKGRYNLTVDLQQQTVTDDEQFNASFEIDDFRRRCFLEGLDQISLTLQHIDKIDEFEAHRNGSQ